MLRTIEGVYRDGTVELTEIPKDVREETQVLATFIEPQLIDLQSRGIDEVQAAELRARFATFIEDWDSPAKLHPVFVVQAGDLHTEPHQVVVAMVTSRWSL